MSGLAPDPPHADQYEAQNFKRLYHLPGGNTAPVASPPSSVSSNGFDNGDAAGVAAGVALMIAAGTVGLRRRGQLRHS